MNMKLIMENFRNSINEFKDSASTLTSEEVFNVLTTLLIQVRDAYVNLLKITQGSISEAKKLKARPVNELIQLVISAQEDNWHLWYENNYNFIKKIFSDLGVEDEEILQNFLRVLAATSQGNKPSGNVTMALKGLRNIYIDKYTTGDEFYQTTDPKKKGEYLPDTAKNLARIANKQDLSGPKISAYAKALAGDEEAIAVDRHIFDIIFDTTTSSKSRRAMAVKQVTVVAKEMGLKPRQIQAALWAANQIRKGKKPQNYIEYIKSKIDTINELLSEIQGISLHENDETQMFFIKNKIEEGAFKGYYNLEDLENPPSIKDLLKRWVEDNEHIYDSNVNDRNPAWYDPKELTPYREYQKYELRNPPNTPEYKQLKKNIEEKGIREPLIIHMGRNGQAKIGEGNHRHQIALELGLDKVPVRFVWYESVRKQIQKPASTEMSPELQDLVKKNKRNKLVKKLSTRKKGKKYDDLVNQIMDLLGGK
jgi:hypothetical protein